MKKLFSIAMFALCGLCGIVNGQETSKDGAAMKSMAAKKMIMAPETMAAAKKSMMGPDSMVPAMVAKEMVRQEVMQDQDVMRMTEKNSMAKPGGDKIMKNDKQASMAGDKMMADPSAMQMLFQELVARHIAARKMAMMKPATPQMTSTAAKNVKAMMMDQGAMMGAKQEMTSTASGAMMMAREELIHSLMLDKEVMALVEKESMMQQDPKMAPMMSDDKMRMTGEAMAKDKTALKSMMQETMARQTVGGNSSMMKEGAKTMMKEGAKPKK